MHAAINGRAADLIIPVHNQYQLTRTLLESIYRHTDIPFHIYLIDNASTDETLDLQKIYARDITVVRNRIHQSRRSSINQGIQLGTNPYLVIMDNDIEVSQGWLGNLTAFLDTHPRIGAVGPLNSNSDHWQYIDHVRETLVPQIPEFLTTDLHQRNRVLKYHFHRAGILVEETLAFSCVALPRRAVEAVGLLDGTFLAGGDSDTYCRRLRKAGYVLGLSLDTYVVHHANAASKSVFNQIRCSELAKLDSQGRAQAEIGNEDIHQLKG
jgi:GT2 family glycosyltransferase